MSWLLDLLPGGGLTAVIAGLVAILGMLGFGLKKARDAGIAEQQAEEAKARAKNLEALKRAVDAGSAVRPGDSVLNDPRNRDNRR